MIPNEEEEGRWHYLAVKKLSSLLHGIISRHKGDFCCLDSLHSFITKNKLKSHEKYVKLSEKDKFDQYLKSDQMTYIIYADVESSC